jgi:hypothetical protein
MSKPKSWPVTVLERHVLERVAAGLSPWAHDGTGSRTISQAVARLHRKGFLGRDPSGITARVITDEGRAAVAHTYMPTTVS